MRLYVRVKKRMVYGGARTGREATSGNWKRVESPKTRKLLVFTRLPTPNPTTHHTRSVLKESEHVNEGPTPSLTSQHDQGKLNSY
jgi:hypothetical protein